MPNSRTSPNTAPLTRVVLRAPSTVQQSPPADQQPPVSPVRRAPIPEPIQLENPEQSPLDELQFQPLIQSLENASAKYDALPQLLNQFAQIASRESDCLAMWIGVRVQTESGDVPAANSDSFPFSDFHPLTDENANVLWETVSETGIKLAAAATEAGQIASTPLPYPTPTHLVAAPVYSAVGRASDSSSREVEAPAETTADSRREVEAPAETTADSRREVEAPAETTANARREVEAPAETTANARREVEAPAETAANARFRQEPQPPQENSASDAGATQTPAETTQVNSAPPADFLLLGCFSETGATVLRLQWLMGILSQALSRWLNQRSSQRSDEQLTHKQTQLSEAFKLMRELSETTTRTEAALLIVNQMRRVSRAGSVAITIDGRLLALSGVEQVDARNENNGFTELACNQAYSTCEPVRFPIDSEDEHAGSAATQTALAAFSHSSRTQACVGFPLKTAGGTTFGGLLISGTFEQLADEAHLKYLGEMAGMIAGQLDVVLRANRSVTEIAKTKLRSVRRHRWAKLALLGVLLVVLVMLLPMPYRVGCDCEIQPVLRRFVAAPYDGVLEKSMVENGQVVSKNELLATLDGRQLRIELSGLSAELAGAKKRRDLALATGDIAQSQIARSEMERYQSKIEMLNRRSENLEVRSPIAGIIVSGDLENVQGAPLKLGQTLFEVAPLDEMVSEIAIPESEISYTGVGMPVAIKLSAFPFQTFEGTVKRIHPKTEMVNDQSVFVAEVSLTSDRVELRPGMKGSAKIQSGWSPLAWNLFHRPWEAVRCWMIW